MENKKDKSDIIFALFASIFIILLIFSSSFNIAKAVYPFEGEQELIMNYIKDPITYGQEMFVNGATGNEMDHLLDVKDVFFKIQFLFLMSLVMSFLLLLIYNWYFELEVIRKTLIYSGIGGIGISLLLVLFNLLSFDFAFELMHKIVFPQGGYSFSYDSYLIMNLPASTFFELGLLIFLMAMLFSMLLLVVSYYLRIKILKKKRVPKKIVHGKIKKELRKKKPRRVVEGRDLKGMGLRKI